MPPSITAAVRVETITPLRRMLSYSALTATRLSPIIEIVTGTPMRPSMVIVEPTPSAVTVIELDTGFATPVRVAVLFQVPAKCAIVGAGGASATGSASLAGVQAAMSAAASSHEKLRMTSDSDCRTWEAGRGDPKRTAWKAAPPTVFRAWFRGDRFRVAVECSGAGTGVRSCRRPGALLHDPPIPDFGRSRDAQRRASLRSRPHPTGHAR